MTTNKTLSAAKHSAIAFLLFLALLATVPTTVHAQTLNLTPEQIAQLQALSPEQREALLNNVNNQTGGSQQVPISAPVTVAPRAVEDTPTQDQTPPQIVNEQLEVTPISSTSEDRLKPFGYELFAGNPTTFAPATNIPVPANYIMGPGDTVIIQMYGQRNVTHELAITREGMLMFPEVGPISVTGLSFGEMRDQIQNVVANQLIGQNASVTMGALRSINIFVLGEAYRPGSYTVSSLSTMTNALFVSGGVTSVGSLRTIRLMRNGELVTELDLYDLLLRGDTSGDARLQPGDVIFIPPIGTTVGIAGEVKRPAIFELRGGETAAQALALTGGFLPTAYPRASRIERINDRGERTLIDVDLSTQSAPNIVVSDGDVIQVASVLDQVESVVMLQGHVQRAGGFQWRDGLRVSDVVPSVTDLMPNPDLDYALIAREIQPTRRIELIYVNLGAAIASPGSVADIAFQPRDQLLTFGASLDRQEQVADLLQRLRDQATFDNPPLIVNVRGNVRFPGEYPLVRDMSAADAISFAGGLRASTELDYLLLERRVDRRGNIQVQPISINPQTLQSDTPILLQELDELIVFNANASREELLASTLQKLRNQSTATNPTQIVAVAGQVRFPGNYPLVQGFTVADLIEVAGGLTESAETREAEITRFDAEPSVGREIGHVVINLRGEGQNGRSLQLSPFDQLVVRQMPNWTDNETVTIGGEVNAPGTYSITKEDTLSSLIARAGGLTNYADARAAIFLREELRENEQRMLNDFRDRLERDIVTRSLQQTTNEETRVQGGGNVTELLDRITNVTATGRLVIDLPTIIAHNDGAKSRDVILRAGDRLLIPRTQQEVSVVGEVNRPTSHLFVAGLSASEYINSSGGFTDDADKSNVYIIKASGEVVPYGGARWFFQQRDRLEAGDSIIVPFDAYQPSNLYVWRNISQILFNISTTILAIERVGN